MDLESRGEVGRNANDISVLALQGGAGDYDTVLAERELLKGLFAKTGKPIPPVGVCKGDAVAHLFDILWGVEL